MEKPELPQGLEHPIGTRARVRGYAQYVARIPDHADKRQRLQDIQEVSAPMPASRRRGGRHTSIDYPRLAEKLMQVYDEKKKKKDEWLRVGANRVGLKLSAFCNSIGRPLPNNVNSFNVNSFRAGIQRQLDKISIDGRSVVLGYSNVVRGTFRPTENTMILWHVVPSSERMSEDERKDAEEVENSSENAKEPLS